MSKRSVVAGVVAVLVLGAGAAALAGRLTSSTHTTSVAVTVPAHTVTVSRPARTVTVASSTSGTTTGTSARSSSAACPPGTVVSRSYNATRGKCVKRGYVPNTSARYAKGTATTFTTPNGAFVDPHGVECSPAFVSHGYCQAP
jgi:hypothetical protein